MRSAIAVVALLGACQTPSSSVEFDDAQCWLLREKRVNVNTLCRRKPSSATESRAPADASREREIERPDSGGDPVGPDRPIGGDRPGSSGGSNGPNPGSGGHPGNPPGGPPSGGGNPPSGGGGGNGSGGGTNPDPPDGGFIDPNHPDPPNAAGDHSGSPNRPAGDWDRPDPPTHSVKPDE